MRPKVGHYDVVEELGRGGMGVVYKGFESQLNRFVAIKLMSESLAHDSSIVERFLREARSMAQLNDPHIIQIYMIGEDAGQPFFAMEFVEGESLSQTLRREGKLDAVRAAGIIAQAAQGLAVAHDRGVIHRDIKPANLMITPRGLVKVADFGIALASQDFAQKLTSTGEFVGTPGYLSPEVCLGQNVDQRSDVFSLGIVFFEMLAGRMPFTDQSPLGLMLEVVRAEIPDVRSLGAEVSPALVAVLNKMLAKDQNERYLNCQDLLDDLGRNGVIASTVNASSLARVTSAATLPQTPRAAPVSAATLMHAPTPIRAAVPPPLAPPPPQPRAFAPNPDALKRNAILPWAIAASLLLGGLTGGAFLLKERIFGDSGSATASASSDAGGGAGSGEAAGKTEADSNSERTSQTSATASEVSSDAKLSGGSLAPAVAEAAPVRAQNQSAELAVANAQALAALREANAELARLKSAPAPAPIAQQQAEFEPTASQANSENAGPRTPLAALRARVEAAPNKRELSPRFASNAPTPSVATQQPSIPRVLVIALGDLGAATAAEGVIEDALSDAGYTLADEDAVPGLGSLRGARGGDAGQAVIAAAQRAGISAVVTVRVTPTGSQELTFYGQTDTRTLATLEVKAFQVGNRSSLDSFREDIGYTGLNAAQSGRDAVQDHLGQLVSKLSAHKARG